MKDTYLPLNLVPKGAKSFAGNSANLQPRYTQLC